MLLAIVALVALLAGATVGICAAVLLGRALGLGEQALRSLAPKSISTPIAMGVAETIGGLPSLTAVLVILTGMTGAICAKQALDLLRFRDRACAVSPRQGLRGAGDGA